MTVKVRYQRILLEKSETLSQPMSVVPWEVPVIAEAHGGGIQDLGQTVVERKRPYDAVSEYQRLVNRYRASEDNATPYVTRVYGSGAAGIQAIQNAIDNAMVGDDDNFGAALKLDEPPLEVDAEPLEDPLSGYGAGAPVAIQQ